MRGPRSAAGRSRRKCRRKFFSGHSKESPHNSLEDFVRSLKPGEYQGGESWNRHPKSTRITFQNIGGICARPSELKYQRLSKWLGDEQVGIAMLAETNCHWPSLREGAKWRDRMRKISPSGYYTATAYNRHQDRTGSNSSFQWGGTAVTAFGKVAHGAKEYGCDPSGLGRWSFIRLRGKLKQKMEVENGIHIDRSQDLVVISAYRPNPPGSGESTVNAQHQLYFDKIGRRCDPRVAFVQDLCKVINKWREEGCEIILGVDDANEDVSVWSPSSFRNKMKEVGLVEAILRLHPKPVATFQLNTQDVPIDAIFVSSGVKVLSAGYLAFDEGPQSDHRALWMDIDLSLTLGGYHPERSSFSRRLLSSQDSRSVKRYLKTVKREYIRYSIPQRLQQLESVLQANDNVFNPTTEGQFNTIHRQAYDIRRAAEAKCRKCSMGKVPWSPLMQGYWDRILLLRMLIKGHKGCRVSSRKIRRLLKKTGMEQAWRWSLPELMVKLRAERKEYKEMKRTKAHAWRRAHIDSRLRAAKSVRHLSKKAKSRFLRLQRMKQREEARRRRCARGKGFSGGLRAIQVPNPGSPNDLITITDQRLVEQGCMDENRARYDQTRFPYPTPPMKEPLYSMFNGAAAEQNSMDLLRGSLSIPPGVDNYTLAFLDQCRFHRDFQPQHLEVSTAVHTEFWRKMDENKGSEPHGLHNGHFKVGCQSPLIAYCDAILRNLPLQSGFVPEQWKNLMNFAIEKQAGDFRLSKMRTIQMMNSEFQANNKLVGKHSMAFAEKHNLIPPGQCGSRKQHQSIDLAVSKRLVWDLLILQRRSAGWISNDAKSCFDRVVHSIAKIALLRFGILWGALAMMFDTLAFSTHRVRTGFGDSEESFEPPTDIAFQGCGQGNGAGPPIWAAVSSILILMMEAAGFGFECLSALSRRLITAQCFAFVDDTDAIEAAKDVHLSVEDIFPSIQSAAKLWSGGIQATGGAINPDKSFCWLLDHEWCPSSGSWKFRKILPNNGLQLYIYGLSGKLEPLQHLQPNQSERTLGVMLAPLEDQQAQFKFVLEKAKEWTEELRPQFLQRYDVIPILKTTILKSLEYPSALSTLSYPQWTEIMKPILRVCLPKAGVCRNFPREMVYAPIKYQGLGIPHPFATQLFHNIDMLLRHPANATQTGSYLQAVLESHQLETGTSFGIFQQVYENTAILASETWVKRVWRQLDEYDIFLSMDIPSLRLRAKHDRFLMEVFMDLEIDQETLKWLNWCRMYLGVTTVSDLVTADGRQLRKAMLLGHRDDQFSSLYEWPRTARPTAPHWRSWKDTLSAALLSTSMTLRRPLSHWCDSLDEWRWLYSPSQELLFHRHNITWVVYQRLITTRPTKRTRSTFVRVPPHCWSVPLPPDVLRATTERLAGDQVLVTGVGNVILTQPSDPSPSILNLWHKLSTQSTPYLGWVPDEIRIFGSEQALFEALMTGELCVISDGSYLAPIGTSATTLTTRNGTDRIVVLTQTPGQTEDQCSYRSELCGMYVGIMVSDWLVLTWGPLRRPNYSRPTVSFGSDGLSALQRAFGNFHIKATDHHFDLLSTVRSYRRTVAFNCRFRHIQAHRDREVAWENLTWWEQRNCEVDVLAGEYRESLLLSGVDSSPNPRFFTEPSALFIGGVKQSKLDQARIQELVALPILRSRWTKLHWDKCVEEEVAWSHVGTAMRSLRSSLQRWTTKNVVGMCGVGKFMKKWGYSPDARCPLCSYPEETAEHVPRCPDKRAEAAWLNQMEVWEHWFNRHRTSPLIASSLFQLLSLIRSPSSEPIIAIDSRFQEALDSQLRIGSQGLLEGRLSRRWIPLQAEYFQEIGSPRSTSTWASQLSSQLLLIGHSMWTNRNSIRHSDDGVHNRELSAQVNQGIIAQFELGLDNLPRKYHQFMAAGLHRVLARPLVARRDWLQLIAAKRRAVRRDNTPQRRIWHEFIDRCTAVTPSPSTR